MTWIEALSAFDRDGTASVLVTVLATRGSTPREAGAKMVVTATGSCGTIGGGHLEQICLDRARALLAGPAEARDGPRTEAFPLGPALGQCCGGHATILFEPVVPVAWQVAVFGAGHVGTALVRLLADLPCRVQWVDSRPDVFPPDVVAGVTTRCTRHPEAEVSSLPERAMAVVMTHDHALDYRIVAACLRRDLPFVGLIGSATKRARFVSRLRAEGLPADRLICPIGISGIGGKLPAEIALATAAQLLQERDRGQQGERAHDADRVAALPDRRAVVIALPGCRDSCGGCA